MLTKKWKDEAIAKAMVELGDWMLKELKLQVRVTLSLPQPLSWKTTLSQY